MNIHEYQAKALLKRYGVVVPRGGVAFTPEEAEKVANELGGPVWVVKSQIHAGGRGAGRFADDGDPASGGVFGGVLVIDERQLGLGMRFSHCVGFRSRLIRAGWSNHQAPSRRSPKVSNSSRSSASRVRISLERVGSMPAMRSAKLW